tara:strand:+ start:115 stop:309 length:195 start_codon:yes stop_codon:yes gene_type:complete
MIGVNTMADKYFKKNYVKNLSDFNEWFENKLHSEDDDFNNNIRPLIIKHGRIGTESINIKKEDI